MGLSGGDILTTLAKRQEEFKALNVDGRLGERLRSMAAIRILDLEVSLERAKRMKELVDIWGVSEVIPETDGDY